jgi:hypothetical protein
MGTEVNCRVEFGGQSSEGRALLETTEILFRGGFRLKIPITGITKLYAADGKLTVMFSEGTAAFHLGAAATKWEQKILHPPTLLDKLGVKPGTKYRIVGVIDEGFSQELKTQGAVASKAEPEIVFLGVGAKDGLSRIPLPGEAPLWIIYPKGQKTITENDVLAAGRAAGWTDIKVASFSKTHTALKFVTSKSKPS